MDKDSIVQAAYTSTTEQLDRAVTMEEHSVSEAFTVAMVATKNLAQQVAGSRQLSHRYAIYGASL